MAGNTRALTGPFKEALEYFQQKQPKTSTHWTEYLNEAHARSFVVAGAASEALVEDFRHAIEKAIRDGTGFNEFRGDFHAIVQKHGWQHTGNAGWRAKIIYNTNLANAYSAGRYAQQTDPAVLAAFPYWEYLHVNCVHPRPQHVAWSGMVLRADDPWWDTHYPPNGWNCHCIVGLMDEHGLASRGLKGPDTAPPMDWREYVNKTTGVVTKYPAGVDPGFAYNPGKVWKTGKTADLTTPDVKPVGPPPPVLARPGEPAVPADVLHAFLQAPQGAVQVAELAPAAAAKGAHVVVLSADALSDGVDEAAIRAVAAEIGGLSKALPRRSPVHVKAAGWAATMRWNFTQGVWEIFEIKKDGQ